MLGNFEKNYSKIINYIDNQDINSYINFIVSQLFATNKYFNDQEPWNKKDNHKRLYNIVYTAFELIRKITILMYPVIPDTALKVMKIFNFNIKDIKFEYILNNNYIKKGTRINKIGILFKKIEKND